MPILRGFSRRVKWDSEGSQDRKNQGDRRSGTEFRGVLRQAQNNRQTLEFGALIVGLAGGPLVIDDAVFFKGPFLRINLKNQFPLGLGFDVLTFTF